MVEIRCRAAVPLPSACGGREGLRAAAAVLLLPPPFCAAKGRAGEGLALAFAFAVTSSFAACRSYRAEALREKYPSPTLPSAFGGREGAKCTAMHLE
ncbi:hypothetical protein D3C81_1742020 [compost metagenome]